MKSQRWRNILFALSDQFETGAKKLRGAANRLSPEKPLTIVDCERQNWGNVRPCFVLSTGRAGTLLLNRLLLRAPNAYSVHTPKPELIRASRRAYEEIEKSPEIFRETFKSAREEIVFDAAQHGKIFIETNNRITFFAPVIRDVFPNAVFIHLVRHPGDFVRSGIRRKWYSGDQDHDLGRIVPVSGEAKKCWDDFSLIQKIGWLWNETNWFVENFRTTVSQDSFLFIRAEDLFTDPAITQNIYEFLHLEEFNRKEVEKIIKNPVNEQKKGKFPEYEEWAEKDKVQLKGVAQLAGKYGYEL